jgi:branched-chain amino acid transport system permease protein
VSFYLATLAVYMVIYALGAWALNLQFGLGGIVNFAFIVFESVGAYAAAITSLGRTGALTGQTYFWGASWPFPLPLIAGAAAGGLLALIVGPATMRKMRRDYQAAAMLVFALIADQVITNDTHLFNGAAGLAGVQQPLSSSLGVSLGFYDWLFVIFAAMIAAAAYLMFRRISLSPLGRTLRALRDDEEAASAVGKNAWAVRMTVFVVGGAVAGLAGALLIDFIGAWSPAAWSYQETFLLLVAIILGGVGNDRGVFLGAFLVGIVLFQAPSFLPAIGYPGLIDSIQWIVIGVVWISVLWLRPSGLIGDKPNLALSRAPRRWKLPKRPLGAARFAEGDGKA